MSELKDIFKAYKKSDYRDPEFDSMMNTVTSTLGISEDEAVDMLSKAWDSGAFQNIESFASAAPQVAEDSMILFKKANSNTLEFDYVEGVLDSLDNAIQTGNQSDVQELSKKIDAVAKHHNIEYRRALFDLIERRKAPTEIIDDMPIMKSIQGVNKDAFDSVKRVHKHGTSKGFPLPGGGSVYVPRPGSINEVADLATELRKPVPDPQALDRFKQIAEAKVGLWGKDADAAKQLVNNFREGEMRSLLSKLNLPDEQVAKLLDNFLLNSGPRMATLVERERGVLGALTRVFSATKGGSALERLKDGGKIMGAPARAFMWLPKMFWKMKGFPMIGKVAAVLAAMGQVGLPYLGYKLMSGDDEKPAAAGPGAASSSSIEDPGLTGNLYDKVRTILNRTFGPRRS